MMKQGLAFASLLLVLPLVRASSEDQPVVTTSQGRRIIGRRLDFNPTTDPSLRRSVDAFMGIPYAEAPVGPLRFKPPVAKSWSGEIQATNPGMACPQPIIPMGNYIMEGPFSEDCLSLAVFVPQPVPSPAAVLVYIHGGGYFAGSGLMLDIYPTALAAVGDVIVVAFNYRLGSLGFLSTNDDVIPGNMGMLDQRLALEWVRDNIEAFGGDPERVAIFGESAGAGSVGLHMVSPLSAGLFKGAIMQSGDAFASWAAVPAAVTPRRAHAFGKVVGCERDTSKDLLECMQKIDDFNIFFDNQVEKLSAELGEDALMAFVPTVDGNFLPSAPADLYAKGAINDAVSIIGSMSDEGMLIVVPAFPNNTDEAPFVDSATYDMLAQGVFSMLLGGDPILAEMVKLTYRNASCKDAPDCDYLESLSQAFGDAMFVCPGEKTAQAFTKAGRKVYRYSMDHVSTTTFMGKKWSKAIHGDDIPFVFGLPLTFDERWTYTEEEARMSIKIMKYWANLAKTGNPNLSSLDTELTDEDRETEWPLFTVEELAYKKLNPTMQNGRAFKAKECLMWNEFMPKLIKLAEEAKKCGEESDAPSQEGHDDKDEQGTCTKETCP